MTTEPQGVQAPAKSAWLTFLNARADAIDELRRNGRRDFEIAHAMRMDELQVRLIRTRDRSLDIGREPAAQAPAADEREHLDHFQWWCDSVDNEAKHDPDWDDHLAEVAFEAGWRAARTGGTAQAPADHPDYDDWGTLKKRDHDAAVAAQAPAPADPQEKIAAVVEAARQWWCERVPRNWDDADLAHAVVAIDGDWPGCPGCNHAECDEPCVPATEAEQHRDIDCAIAQLVHDGKLLASEGYKPPDGWVPIVIRKRDRASQAPAADERAEFIEWAVSEGVPREELTEDPGSIHSYALSAFSAGRRSGGPEPPRCSGGARRVQAHRQRRAMELWPAHRRERASCRSAKGGLLGLNANATSN